MRYPLILGLGLFLAAAAGADRVITIPMGRKITFNDLKIDSFAELSSGRTWDRFVGYGLTADFEIDYHGEKIDNGPMRDTFDFSYNYLAPIINQSPGLSAGIQDVLNRTRNGRRYYIAATWREAADMIGTGKQAFEATLGMAQGSRLTPFVGASMPFSDSLRAIVEHDGFRIATGIEYRPLKSGFAARLIFRDQDVMVGATLNLRF